MPDKHLYQTCVQLSLHSQRASQGGSVVKNPPANAGDLAQSLGREDPPEKEVATHCSILAWRIPWTEIPAGLWSVESQKLDMT